MQGTFSLASTDSHGAPILKTGQTTIHSPFRIQFMSGGSAIRGFIIDDKEQWLLCGQNQDGTWRAIQSVAGHVGHDTASLTKYINSYYDNWSWVVVEPEPLTDIPPDATDAAKTFALEDALDLAEAASYTNANGIQYNVDGSGDSWYASWGPEGMPPTHYSPSGSREAALAWLSEDVRTAVGWVPVELD